MAQQPAKDYAKRVRGFIDKLGIEEEFTSSSITAQAGVPQGAASSALRWLARHQFIVLAGTRPPQGGGPRTAVYHRTKAYGDWLGAVEQRLAGAPKRAARIAATTRRDSGDPLTQAAEAASNLADALRRASDEARQIRPLLRALRAGVA